MASGTGEKGGVNFVMDGRTPTRRTATTWMVTAVGGCARMCMRACMRDVFAIYDNIICPRLIVIIIKTIILYFIQITHTDDFPQRVPG